MCSTFRLEASSQMILVQTKSTGFSKLRRWLQNRPLAGDSLIASYHNSVGTSKLKNDPMWSHVSIRIPEEYDLHESIHRENFLCHAVICEILEIKSDQEYPGTSQRALHITFALQSLAKMEQETKDGLPSPLHTTLFTTSPSSTNVQAIWPLVRKAMIQRVIDNSGGPGLGRKKGREYTSSDAADPLTEWLHNRFLAGFNDEDIEPVESKPDSHLASGVPTPVNREQIPIQYTSPCGSAAAADILHRAQLGCE
ncbi:hypothetical protein SBOR_9185 [Sclerotinia borealis F-4128]|uniref:Uncharacterized protein n=1 Tax=Sclerotinia borealis (strain F-4128) TaxID=1432307 RepID=W9C789_SCLBF|nr:hypothetical protein SBOR_9185 [Sclerotinia borealis F-4128]